MVQLFHSWYIPGKHKTGLQKRHLNCPFVATLCTMIITESIKVLISKWGDHENEVCRLEQWSIIQPKVWNLSFTADWEELDATVKWNSSGTGSQSSFYMWKLKSCRPVSRTAVVRIGQVWGCKKDGSICLYRSYWMQHYNEPHSNARDLQKPGVTLPTGFFKTSQSTEICN